MYNTFNIVGNNDSWQHWFHLITKAHTMILWVWIKSTITIDRRTVHFFIINATKDKIKLLIRNLREKMVWTIKMNSNKGIQQAKCNIGRHYYYSLYFNIEMMWRTTRSNVEVFFSCSSAFFKSFFLLNHFWWRTFFQHWKLTTIRNDIITFLSERIIIKIHYYKWNLSSCEKEWFEYYSITRNSIMENDKQHHVVRKIIYCRIFLRTF